NHIAFDKVCYDQKIPEMAEVRRKVLEGGRRQKAGNTGELTNDESLALLLGVDPPDCPLFQPFSLAMPFVPVHERKRRDITIGPSSANTTDGVYYPSTASPHNEEYPAQRLSKAQELLQPSPTPLSIVKGMKYAKPELARSLPSLQLLDKCVYSRTVKPVEEMDEATPSSIDEIPAVMGWSRPPKNAIPAPRYLDSCFFPDSFLKSKEQQAWLKEEFDRRRK
ncbi:hypothetical protein FOZ61_002845, partial [Perkinsus olseni]